MIIEHDDDDEPSNDQHKLRTWDEHHLAAPSFLPLPCGVRSTQVRPGSQQFLFSDSVEIVPWHSTVIMWIVLLYHTRWQNTTFGPARVFSDDVVNKGSLIRRRRIIINESNRNIDRPMRRYAAGFEWNHHTWRAGPCRAAGSCLSFFLFFSRTFLGLLIQFPKKE